MRLRLSGFFYEKISITKSIMFINGTCHDRLQEKDILADNCQFIKDIDQKFKNYSKNEIKDPEKEYFFAK